MKTLITTLLLSISTFSFGQTFDQLGPAFSGTALTSDPVEVFYDSQNNPIVAKMQNGSLRVDKFDGSSWSAIDPAVPVVATGIEDFELDFSTATNTIIVIYVDGNTLYLREYDDGWQAEVTIGTYTTSNDDQCDIAINPDDQVAYVSYNSSGGGSAWVQFDYANDNLTTMPTIPLVTPGIYFDQSDMAYNEKDGLLYLVYENYVLNDGVATFDGTNWTDVMTGVDGMSSTTTTLNITAAFDTAGTNELMVYLATIPDKEVGIVSYSMPGLVMSSPEPWYAPASIGPLYGCDMTMRHSNNYPTYAYVSYPSNDMILTIKYWDGSQWNSVNNSLDNHRIMDIAYDQDDNLLLATIFEDDIQLRVYRVNIHTVGITEITASNVQVYPNPATTILNVESDDFCAVRVLNVIGEEVLNQVKLKKTHTLDLQGLNSGVYFVETISEDGSVSSSKFTKH